MVITSLCQVLSGLLFDLGYNLFRQEADGFFIAGVQHFDHEILNAGSGESLIMGNG
jgi:hypothetical protein